MAKVGKLTKLKSAMKRLPSLTKLSRSSSSSSIAVSDEHHHEKSCSKDLQIVYVGKSRRRYYLSPHIICHPLFQQLIDRSSSSSSADAFDDKEVLVISCEVVLFEHLLWMLESGETQLGSMQELAEFYTC